MELNWPSHARTLSSSFPFPPSNLYSIRNLYFARNRWPFMMDTGKDTALHHDDLQLAGMGYRPQLKRQFSTW